MAQNYQGHDVGLASILLHEFADDRKALAFQNKDTLVEVLICNRQKFSDDEAMTIYPGQMIGRDVASPSDAFWARLPTGTAAGTIVKLLTIEDR